ncbi:hypothetical protein EJ05DRAFT_433604 [Pseudovirgaria hyperparasitica]|uniref:HRQ family protein n=1 Tax=Pseudovirgaria hyperparasitica TaxID=470096 RepID=A0A6A6WNB8_9PEZI|nr:uncharacterized protein EJ05DRAFT_433604 [Pseudovirgaria hyperparasitica]KAF2763576.1 hypothetical protein EJ05DRAFT_433604 [Pseudovirgaria hyperparasitica]
MHLQLDRTFGSSSLLLFACFLVISLSYLGFNRKRRGIILLRLQFYKRRTSGANTPPRSIRPEKAFSTQELSYKNVFPPQRRETLGQIGNELLVNLKKPIAGIVALKDVASNTTCVPLETSIWDTNEVICTPTGFSSDEIKALGDFPDYATLSGVSLPAPYPEFDIDKALPRPYRPFRWPYHQTMSLMKMENNWWIELEHEYASKISQRQKLVAEHGKNVLDYLPGSELACKELMEMVLQFLCARYPHYFSLDVLNMTFHNDILRTKADLRSEHPLHVLLNHVPEDFAITLRDPETGHYYFRAGVICSSLGWNVASKIGLRLDEIHQPIPDYKEKMQFSMDRYFARKPTDRPIQRGSWGLEVDTPLYMPPGDPHEIYRDIQDPTITLSRCHLRVDWQTLRRLPLSAGIVFNFKALFTPIEALRDEPRVPLLLLKVLEEGKESLMKYKNSWHVEHVVCPALREWSAEQARNGKIEQGWEVHTLEESPWFEGWKEKWKRQQGF